MMIFPVSVVMCVLMMCLIGQNEFEINHFCFFSFLRFHYAMDVFFLDLKSKPHSKLIEMYLFYMNIY